MLTMIPNRGSDEERLKEGLRKLLDEAEKAIREKMPEVLFAYDGFFPLYTEQGTRVLIVGREAYGDYGTYRRPDEKVVSITDVAYDEYRHNELFRGGCNARFDAKALTRRSVMYHARCIALAYSIITGDWNVQAEKIEEIASKIGKAGCKTGRSACFCRHFIRFRTENHGSGVSRRRPRRDNKGSFASKPKLNFCTFLLWNGTNLCGATWPQSGSSLPWYTTLRTTW